MVRSYSVVKSAAVVVVRGVAKEVALEVVAMVAPTAEAAMVVAHDRLPAQGRLVARGRMQAQQRGSCAQLCSRR